MEGQREGSDKSEFMEKLETGTRRAESPPPLRAGRRLQKVQRVGAEDVEGT